MIRESEQIIEVRGNMYSQRHSPRQESKTQSETTVIDTVAETTATDAVAETTVTASVSDNRGIRI